MSVVDRCMPKDTSEDIKANCTWLVKYWRYYQVISTSTTPFLTLSGNNQCPGALCFLAWQSWLVPSVLHNTNGTKWNKFKRSLKNENHNRKMKVNQKIWFFPPIIYLNIAFFIDLEVPLFVITGSPLILYFSNADLLSTACL